MAQTKEGALKCAAKRAGCTVEEYTAHIKSGEKWCYKCRQWKPRDEAFGKDATRSDGLEPKCYQCRHVKEYHPNYRKPPNQKGMKRSKETRERCSKANMGNTHRLGKPWTEEHLVNLRTQVRAHILRGPDHPRWRGGITPITQRMRYSDEYKAWRKAVYQRDNYTCQHCGSQRGGTLCAHHIQSWADYPELRFDVSNGITLCNDCHALQHPNRKVRNLFQRKPPRTPSKGYQTG